MDDEIKLIEVKKVLDEYAEKFQTLLKRNITDNGNVASGELLASIKTELNINGDVYSVILNSREYLKYLEEGTKPHWPPVNAMLTWVKQKKLPTRENTGDKKLPTENQLAYLVGRKISRYGTEPRGLIFKTEQELNAVYTQKIEEALLQDINNWLPIINIKITYR